MNICMDNYVKKLVVTSLNFRFCNTNAIITTCVSIDFRNVLIKPRNGAVLCCANTSSVRIERWDKAFIAIRYNVDVTGNVIMNNPTSRSTLALFQKCSNSLFPWNIGTSTKLQDIHLYTEDESKLLKALPCNFLQIISINASARLLKNTLAKAIFLVKRGWPTDPLISFTWICSQLLIHCHVDDSRRHPDSFIFEKMLKWPFYGRRTTQSLEATNANSRPFCWWNRRDLINVHTCIFDLGPSNSR